MINKKILEELLDSCMNDDDELIMPRYRFIEEILELLQGDK